jgi:hypothetical protein
MIGSSFHKGKNINNDVPISYPCLEAGFKSNTINPATSPAAAHNIKAKL